MNVQHILLHIDLLVFFRYFAQNFDWLDEQLDEIEDDYFVFDCPGIYYCVYWAFKHTLLLY